jgi:hypothetical protein
MIIIKEEPLFKISIRNKSVELTEEEMYELYLELNKKYTSTYKNKNDEIIEKVLKEANNNQALEGMNKIINHRNHTTQTINTIPLACQQCSSHPSNGGIGICHCTLGSQVIY